MLATAKIYLAFAASAGAILVAGLLVHLGYRAGAEHVQAEWDVVEKDRATAIVGLAQRYATADAELADARAQARRLSQARLNDRKYEIRILPDRACGWTASEHRVLHAAYCDSNPAGPGCLPDPLRPPDPAPRPE